MSGRILVVCASRSRPDRLARMVASLERTSTEADVAVWVDDDQVESYSSVPGSHRMMVGPRIGQCGSLNRLVKKSPGYEVYGAATDDCTFETPGWDRWVLSTAASLPRQIGLIAPFSGKARRMDFPWMTAAWVDLTGSFCCLKTHQCYWDVGLQLLGESTSIRFAKPEEFTIWHESLDNDNQAAANLSEMGTVIYRVYHVHNDARVACVWLAHEKPELADRINAAAIGEKL